MSTAPSSDGRIAMFIRSTAAPGRRDDCHDLFVEHLATRAVDNPAQEVVVWCADQHDDDVFHLFEVYTHADALAENAQSSWFADYMAAAMPMLAGEPTVAMTTPMWATGV